MSILNRAKKGIILKYENGKQIIMIHPETFNEWMEGMRRNDKGWLFLQVSKLHNHKLKSHEVFPLEPTNSPDTRQIKIDGPKEFKG